MVDMTNDVARFEAMFADRFTEKDEKFMDLKAKSLSHPTVMYPWKIQRRQFTKRWDYSSGRNQDNRGQRDRNHYDRQRNDDRHRNHSRGEGNSRSNYRDRSPNTDRSRDRHDRSYDRDGKYDYQAALKAYSER